MVRQCSFRCPAIKGNISAICGNQVEREVDEMYKMTHPHRLKSQQNPFPIGKTSLKSSIEISCGMELWTGEDVSSISSVGTHGYPI